MSEQDELVSGQTLAVDDANGPRLRTLYTPKGKWRGMHVWRYLDIGGGGPVLPAEPGTKLGTLFLQDTMESVLEALKK